ncbi:hypothetical protein ID853_13550 [Xenorhabdus sp. Vera]|uniref:hypothetical protein n=1 Tax=Xenorhabdus koppenhoeferi TaxID=351659 RepID=UPI00198BC248|nr:hypothetical protein [Xenorhabdus sp. Vera]MBD2811885.1 hypothetical protein [Xenorhabdus sp. Vera]
MALEIDLNDGRFSTKPNGRGGTIIIVDDDTKYQLVGNGREIMLNSTLEREDIISVLNDHYQNEREVA